MIWNEEAFNEDCIDQKNQLSSDLGRAGCTCGGRRLE
jgi:hypothetical protein